MRVRIRNINNRWKRCLIWFIITMAITLDLVTVQTDRLLVLVLYRVIILEVMFWEWLWRGKVLLWYTFTY